MTVTGIEASDWPAILQIQSEVYVDVAPEPDEVMMSKWVASPELCFTFKNENAEALGYLLAHRWTSLTPPKLYQITQSNNGEVLFIHDLAVSPKGKRLGIGKSLVMQLLSTARQQGIKQALLVSIQNSQGFWQQFGFVVDPCSVSSTYGESAVIMSRTL